MYAEQMCQSCGMPMGETDEMYGTEADGRKSEDYCEHCFRDGQFTSDLSMDKMIEISIPHVISALPQMTEDAARGMMRELYPTLKRWS